jgi:2-dehydropantoate 2-reductase
MLENKGQILEYAGAKDARLKCRLFGDENAESAVVYVHGLEDHGEWFCDVAANLAARGFAVYLPDRRGAGLNSADRGDCRHYQTLLDDLVRFIDLIHERHKFIHLAGFSWGGKFALYFAIRRQFMIDSLVLISPALAEKAGIGAFTKFRIALSLMLGRNRYYRTRIKSEMYARDPDALAYIEGDLLRLTAVTASFVFNSTQMDRYLAENADGLRVPVKILLAGNDAVVDNVSGLEMAARFHSRKMEIAEYPDSSHCVFFEKPEKFADDVATWIGGKWRAPVVPCRILIAGAGAVGSLVGGLLAKAGHDVTLLARETHAEPINRRGLVMGLYTVKRTIVNIKAATSAEGVGRQEIVIITAKSYDTTTIAEQIAPVCGAETVVVSLQNGIGNEAALAQALPTSKIAGGAILGYFSVPEPGTCLHWHDRGGIMVAPFARMTMDDAASLRDTLSDSGLIVRIHENCDAVKWSKLLLNVSFNALSALTGMPVEIILTHKELYGLNRRLFRECVAVMEKLGIPAIDLPGYNVVAQVKAARKRARRRRKVGTSELGGMSSIWQDVRKGKGRTEVDFINGVVVGRGKRCGVPTPANAHVARLVNQLASGEVPVNTFAKNLALVYRVKLSP